MSVLSRQTAREGDAGVGEKTIEAIERNLGRVPEARIIEALARALAVQPDDFYEYPIAVARRDSKLPTQAEREAADDREAAALREEARLEHERRASAPDTKRASRRRGGQAS